jgi:hypothetical protein
MYQRSRFWQFGALDEACAISRGENGDRPYFLRLKEALGPVVSARPPVAAAVEKGTVTVTVPFPIHFRWSGARFGAVKRLAQSHKGAKSPRGRRRPGSPLTRLQGK